jgi:aspartyl-tRNA(Asn)/glutamyl-tRNA(Gln) amidotransferase subunit A
MREVNAYGGIVQPEACAVHRDRIKRRAADIDPNVRVRLERGCAVSAADYFDMMQARTRLVRAMDHWLASLDVLVMPTTPIVAPTMAEVTGWENYAARNTLVLRNTSVGNFFDLCGISLPLKAKLPVGLMLMARNGHDRMLLRIAAAVEKALAS